MLVGPALGSLDSLRAIKLCIEHGDPSVSIAPFHYLIMDALHRNNLSIAIKNAVASLVLLACIDTLAFGQFLRPRIRASELLVSRL